MTGVQVTAKKLLSSLNFEISSEVLLRPGRQAEIKSIQPAAVTIETRMHSRIIILREDSSMCGKSRWTNIATRPFGQSCQADKICSQDMKMEHPA
jgi:hypothetical protein